MINYKSKRGLALAAVVMIFAVTTILTVSIVGTVYSDNKFSKDDENRKIAFYIARSAISVVEQSINKELALLDTFETNLKTAKSNFDSAAIEDKIVQKALWDAAQVIYQNQYDFIMGKSSAAAEGEQNVLPYLLNGEVNHIVTFPSNMGSTTDIINQLPVKIVKIASNKYRMESTATINGTPVKVARSIVVSNSGSEDLNISSINYNNIFDNAILTIDDLDANKTGSVSGGNVSYGAGNHNFTVTGGTMTTHSSIVVPEDLPYASTVFASSAGIASIPALNKVFKDDGKTILKGGTNAGYFGETEISNNINVDTKDGDVILAFESLEVSNNFTVNVKSSTNSKGALYMYIDNELKGHNQFKLIVTDTTDQKSEIYLFINGTGKLELENSLGGNYAYIYAPELTIELKNNFGGPSGNDYFKGAIVAENLSVKNNSKIEYFPPRNNVNYGSGTIGTITATQRIYNTSMSEEYWLNN